MNEVATQHRKSDKSDFTLAEIPWGSGGRRFRIADPERGLSREAVEEVRRNRTHFINLLEPQNDVGIRAKCEVAREGVIRVFQTNLEHPYFFDANTGAYVE